MGVARMAGQVAIVTGSAAGIGRATALAFAREGARVTINYSRSEAEAHQVADEVRAAGAEALVVRADVAQVPEVDTLVRRTVDAWGRLDLLVNNAGTTKFAAYEDLDALDEATWDRILAVNVKGVYFASKAAAAAMRPNGGGCIVNVASVAGLAPVGSSIAYNASKAAVISLTQSLARALAPAIRVNAVAPGFIETRWHAGRQLNREAFIERTPLQRNGTPEDVAEVILSLVTSAGFVTGQTVTVDGGRLLG